LRNINVSQSVQNQLSKGEEVIGTYLGRNADYFATNKRLLRFTSETKYQSLDYNTISVNLVNRRVGINIIRLIAIGFGILICALGLLIIFDSSMGIDDVDDIIGVTILFVMGLVTILIGAVLNIAWLKYYQIQAPGVAGNDLREWRLTDSFSWAGNATKFVEIIKQKSTGH